MLNSRDLRARLEKARRHAAQGRDLIVRQKAMIRHLEESRYDTAPGVSILTTMLQTQLVYENHVAQLEEAVSRIAPEEDAVADDRPAKNKGNRLLASLSNADLALVQPYLKRVELKVRQRLHTAHRDIDAVHFPDSGLAAVFAVTRSGRHQTQIGLLGSEGATAYSIAFDSTTAFFDVQVEVPGEALRISISDLANLLKSSPSLRKRIFEYLNRAWLQFALVSAVNAQGTVEQRLACLLLMAQNCIDSDDLPLTHEQLATMLAVRRASVTKALQDLESDGLLVKHRGAVTISDRSGLERRMNYLAPKPHEYGFFNRDRETDLSRRSPAIIGLRRDGPAIAEA